MITYTIGAPPLEWTTLQLDPAGTYDLRSTATPDQQEHHFTGTLPPQRLEPLLALLHAGAPVWTVTHIRKRRPGEQIARIETPSAAAELWTSEVAHVPEFQRVTDLLVDLIREISEGVVVEPGR